ncbi:MAG: glycosyltransferase family 39 protein, partial [Rhodobacteraceae bacterium]|nr:glycosyltransferase family 39 protein [Paracoccaceae bacterium]
MTGVTRASDMQGWFGRALMLVALVTLARLVALAFNRTDLFVDESQYWLWGQNLDLGYYSKPPLIAWLIRAVTSLAGSDAPFWVRMPGALLHGGTALLLASLTARLSGARAAFWVAVAYVTLPFVAVGSLLISTDTVLAPCFAAALYFWFRLVEARQARWALMAGLAIGFGFLAKYAAIYFLLGAGLSAVFVPLMRVGWRNGGWFLLVFGLTIAPNVVWNLTHGLATVNHTMDNIGWVRAGGPHLLLHPNKLADFAGSQFVVFGPVLLLAYLVALTRARAPEQRALLLFSLPVLMIVSGQALLERAYANWAVS